MGELSQLAAVIKKQLKQQGRTYQDLAAHLNLSEPSIKRMFATENFGAERLVSICNYLGYTLAELALEAQAHAMRIHTLKPAQEQELVSDSRLLLVAVLALNHWTMADMLDKYRFESTECLKYLLKLDRMGLISVLPGNRIRLNVTRDFEWISNGPIRQFFNRTVLSDFLHSPFADADDTQNFSHGMLSRAAFHKLQAELKLLRKKFAELHEESLKEPLENRRGIGMLVVMRGWEPEEFRKLHRQLPVQTGEDIRGQ